MTTPDVKTLVAEARAMLRSILDARAETDGRDIGISDIEKMVHRLADALSQPIAGVPEGWRPISTAPKDGTDILVWGPHGHDCMVVWWAEDGASPYCWETLDGPTYGDVFTHWQPLPEPPTP